MSKLGRIADVTRAMLAFTRVMPVGVPMAYPGIPVGLPSDIVGLG